MKWAKKLLIAVLLLSMVALAKKRDPLTEAETDQLREVAMEPGKRLKLYFKFAGARLDSIDQLRSDPKAVDGRGKKIHDLLQDFTAILDEINDNLDTYAGRPLNKDERKEYRNGLKEAIVSGEKFSGQLRALGDAAQNDPQTRKEAADFQFALQDAMEALKSSMAVARESLNAKADEGEKKK
jgi:hypothetical protein